jgi:hypothetical protein
VTTVSFRAAAAVASVAGAAGWLGIGHVTHRQEAWDSDLYFTWFLPSLAALLVGLGFFAPDKSARLGFFPFAGQAVVMFARNPSANLLPLGLILLAVYGAVFMVPASLGGRLRRWLDSRSARP